MTFRDFWQPLSRLYGDDEARAIARLVMERRFDLSMTDIACGAVERIDEEELKAVVSRLLTGEPVQYVLGEAEFCGRLFRVEPGVLIPRPETEWLCWKAVEMMVAMESQHKGQCGSCNILDIGTGSACIACTVALEAELDRRDSLHAKSVESDSLHVTAWDISERAIAVARSNALALGAKVKVEKQDALTPPSDVHRWDIIVSNPPYVCEKEKKAMHKNVLDHEPAEALFVPDDDPLLFYRVIGSYAVRALKPGGALLLEINPLYASELQDLLSRTALCPSIGEPTPNPSLGEGRFAEVEIHEDIFGKKRFAKATHPQPLS